ncbi:MAG: hypothetical protein ACK559_00050, partial [bacterium]
NGPCGGEDDAWGDRADEARKVDQDHQMPRCGVRHKSILRLAEQGGGHEVLEVPRTIHGGAIRVSAC